MIAPTAIKDWDRVPVSDRPRYKEALKRLMKRDPRVTNSIKKMSAGQARLYGVPAIWTARASRKDRVILAPEGQNYHIFGFVPRKDHRFFGSESIR